MGAAKPIVVGQTMFDQIPFANVTDNNMPVQTDQSQLLSPAPPKSVVDGT